jgi:hypothetical protein
MGAIFIEGGARDIKVEPGKIGRNELLQEEPSDKHPAHPFPNIGQVCHWRIERRA